MARMKHGPYGPIVGKIGNTIGYIRKGEPILKMCPTPSTKPRTLAQIAASDRMRVVMEIVSPFNSFTNIGFKLAAKGTTHTAQNKAVSYQLDHALQGVYPNLSLDYSKVRLAAGTLNPPEETSISYEDGVLTFKWKNDSPDKFNNYKLRAMLAAFLPDSGQAAFSIMAARKHEGEDLLSLNPKKLNSQGHGIQDRSIEAYMAFISEDGEAISNSVYVGRIEL